MKGNPNYRFWFVDIVLLLATFYFGIRAISDSEYYPSTFIIVLFILLVVRCGISLYFLLRVVVENRYYELLMSLIYFAMFGGILFVYYFFLIFFYIGAPSVGDH